MKYLLFILLAVLSSCSRVGEYFTDIKNADIEDVQINEDSSRMSLKFAAFSDDKTFTSTVMFRLKDTTIKDFTIKNISFKINGVSSLNAYSSFSSIDLEKNLSYKKLSEIPGLNDRIHLGLPLGFSYHFDNHFFSKTKTLSILFTYQLNENGRDTSISKLFIMDKHIRYKSIFTAL